MCVKLLIINGVFTNHRTTLVMAVSKHYNSNMLGRLPFSKFLMVFFMSVGLISNAKADMSVASHVACFEFWNFAQKNLQPLSELHPEIPRFLARLPALLSIENPIQLKQVESELFDFKKSLIKMVDHDQFTLNNITYLKYEFDLYNALDDLIIILQEGRNTLYFLAAKDFKNKKIAIFSLALGLPNVVTVGSTLRDYLNENFRTLRSNFSQSELKTPLDLIFKNGRAVGIVQTESISRITLISNVIKKMNHLVPLSDRISEFHYYSADSKLDEFTRAKLEQLGFIIHYKTTK